MTAHLIVNADDFGLSPGVNQGIIEAHVHGIVTSASLMTMGPAAADAAAAAHEHPALSVGLHWVANDFGPQLDLQDPDAVRKHLVLQVDWFRRLVGCDPTHLDSHHHVHSSDPLVREVFADMEEVLGIPVRGGGAVEHLGGFYAQWELGVTELEHVSVDALQRLLREEVGRDGWTELSCHPGRVTGDFDSVYLHERETELQTLCDSRVRVTIRHLGIQLGSYSDWARNAPRP